MKLRLFAAVAATVLMATSCGVLGGGAQTAPAQDTTSTGSSIGATLASLYAKYKTTGQIDLTDLSNILDLAQILADLKGMGADATNALQSTEFANGLIAGSNNLISKANVATVLANLRNILNLDLSAITNAARKVKNGGAQAAEAAAEKVKTGGEQVNTALAALLNILRSIGK